MSRMGYQGNSQLGGRDHSRGGCLERGGVGCWRGLVGSLALPGKPPHAQRGHQQAADDAESRGGKRIGTEKGTGD